MLFFVLFLILAVLAVRLVVWTFGGQIWVVWGSIFHWRGKNSEKWMGEILDENADILTSAKRLENACKTIKSREMWSFFDRKGAFRRRFIVVLFCTLAVVAMRLVLGSNSDHFGIIFDDWRGRNADLLMSGTARSK